MTDIIVTTRYVNDPPKNVTFKNKQCEALLDRRDVLSGYVHGTPALRLGAPCKIHFSSPSLC